jgi:pyruvate-ferredoxin/flavodoxin oxidoreductase
MEQQKAAVLSGHWPLFRYDPRRAEEGKNPFQLDSRPPTLPLQKYAYNETRYTMLAQSKPEVARQLLSEAQQDVAQRWRLYEHWASFGNGACEEASHD